MDFCKTHCCSDCCVLDEYTVITVILLQLLILCHTPTSTTLPNLTRLYVYTYTDCLKKLCLFKTNVYNCTLKRFGWHGSMISAHYFSP